MKELLKDSFDSNKVEIVEEKQQRKEIKLIGQQRRIPGLTLFEYNEVTHKVVAAKFRVASVFITGGVDNETAYTYECVVHENCTYVQALNVRNAIKKLRRQGFTTFTAN